MAVDMGVDTIQPFEELAESGGESFGKGDTDARGKVGFVVDEGLSPGHQVFNVFWGGHLGWALEGLGVLPEVFEPGV